MKNFIQHGRVLSMIAPYAVASGAGVLVGSIFGVATHDAANGAAVEVITQGVFDITALTTDTPALGAKLYWDNANKRLTTTSAGNTLVGAAVVAKTNGETTARVYLDGCVR